MVKPVLCIFRRPHSLDVIVAVDLNIPNTSNKTFNVSLSQQVVSKSYLRNHSSQLYD